MSISTTIVTSDYTLDPLFQLFFVDASSNNITITIPAILGDGDNWSLRRIDNSANTVTLQSTNPSETIDGAVSVTLFTGSAVKIVAINSLWFISDSGNANVDRLINPSVFFPNVFSANIAANQNIASGATADVIFGTTNYNTIGTFSVNTTLTIPNAGYYRASAILNYSSLVAGLLATTFQIVASTGKVVTWNSQLSTGLILVNASAALTEDFLLPAGATLKVTANVGGVSLGGINLTGGNFSIDRVA